MKEERGKIKSSVQTDIFREAFALAWLISFRQTGGKCFPPLLLPQSCRVLISHGFKVDGAVVRSLPQPHHGQVSGNDDESGSPAVRNKGQFKVLYFGARLHSSFFLLQSAQENAFFEYFQTVFGLEVKRKSEDEI